MNASILFILMFLTLVSCKSNLDKKELGTNEPDHCVPYFQYDAVDHFSISIEEDAVWNLEEKTVRSAKEKRLLNILWKDELHNLSDTLILMNLQEIGFEQRRIPKEKFDQLDRLFCERLYEEIAVNTCAPIYRDILLFRKHNRITGFAQLCFDCDQGNIIGSNRDTQTFGQAGEFAALGKILK